MNMYIKYIAILVIILYSSLLKPKSYSLINNLFKNSIFRLVYLSYVVYIANSNTQLALTLSVAFLITMQYFREKEVIE